MNREYTVHRTLEFDQMLSCLSQQTQEIFEETLNKLVNPDKYNGLNSHRYKRMGKKVWGSYVNKKDRIFWEYAPDWTIIVTGLAIDSH